MLLRKANVGFYAIAAGLGSYVATCDFARNAGLNKVNNSYCPWVPGTIVRLNYLYYTRLYYTIHTILYYTKL